MIELNYGHLRSDVAAGAVTPAAHAWHRHRTANLPLDKK